MDTQYNPAEDIRIRLLMVDDDINLLETLSQLLTRKGYIVTPAAGSVEANTILKNNYMVFDAVVTDLCMPEIDGIELAMMIKELPVKIPVILHTGKIDLIDEKQIAQAGIAEIIAKPYRIEKLDEIIKKAIKENGKQ